MSALNPGSTTDPRPSTDNQASARNDTTATTSIPLESISNTARNAPFQRVSHDTPHSSLDAIDPLDRRSLDVPPSYHHNGRPRASTDGHRPHSSASTSSLQRTSRDLPHRVFTDQDTSPGLRRRGWSRSSRTAVDPDVPFIQQVKHYDPTTSSDSDSDGESERDVDMDVDHLDGTGINGPDGRAAKLRKKLRDRLAQLHVGNEHFRTKGRVLKDGRLHISVNEFGGTGYVAGSIAAMVRRRLRLLKARQTEEKQEREDALAAVTGRKTMGVRQWWTDPATRPRLNIVIIVIGSRGDIQPFIKIGKTLKNDYGHRVRVATHPQFREFVETDSGLEFFSIGGNPSELMAFMVKNAGLVPNLETVKAGEIGRRRKAMSEMFNGMWKASVHTTDDEHDLENLMMLGDKSPFIADVILANPPSMVHVDIAERLGIPCHLMFTFPYSPTTAFPHPLANIKRSNIELGYANFMSYPLVETMVWQGLGDLVNKFRERVLGSEAVSKLWAPGREWRLAIPHTYMWSPSLVPKPSDWGEEIAVTGYSFLELASTYAPPEDLAEFLDGGEPPVYIGFGSIVVDDPAAFTKLIFEAVKIAGVRALVSKGWGGLGGGASNPRRQPTMPSAPSSSAISASSSYSQGEGEEVMGEGGTGGNEPEEEAVAEATTDQTAEGIQIPDNILLLDTVPHDWLFPRCSAVVHHGGAGTTAIGLKCGKPTVIVPFFGDQPFWGDMMAKSGAGASQSTPFRQLTAEKLATAIRECLTDEAREKAAEIGRGIDAEGDGAKNAVIELFRWIPMGMPDSTKLGEKTMRCSVLKNHVAVWETKRKQHGAGRGVRLSVVAAEALVESKKLQWKDLRLVRHQEWNDFIGPGGPITGFSAAGLHSVKEMFSGIGRIPVRIGNNIRKRAQHYRKVRTFKKAVRVREKRQANKEEKDDVANPSIVSAGPTEYLVVDVVRETANGFKHTFKAIFKLPMVLLIALADGFHNAPRLYGDNTVRRPIRITGIKSGLRAGRNELLYGVYDGVTGLVMHPVRKGREDGLVGGLVGVGMGVGGFINKGLAAIFGPLAYPLKGIEHQYSRWRGRGPEGLVRRTRIAEGGHHVKHTDRSVWAETKQDVVARWDLLLAALALEKQHGKTETRKERALRKKAKFEGKVKGLDVPTAEDMLVHGRTHSLDEPRRRSVSAGATEGLSQEAYRLRRQSTAGWMGGGRAKAFKNKAKGISEA